MPLVLKQKSVDVCLVGPFIGELSWEYFRFAPYIIHLIKTNPLNRFIVFTRPDRFDFYGSYVDIFVPLKITNDLESKQRGFKIDDFSQEHYEKLLKVFILKYKNNYKIVDKIYPDITAFSYKVRWQFPRKRMDYDFKPRKGNYEVIKNFIAPECVFIDTSIESHKDIQLENYSSIITSDFLDNITPFVKNPNISKWGCYIEAIKNCQFVIGNLSSHISRMALLLNKPLITINEKLSNDSIHLINPLETPVISCTNIEEGIRIYEDNF
jgi:hypothetical protein